MVLATISIILRSATDMTASSPEPIILVM